MKERIYIYPMRTENELRFRNPYIYHLSNGIKDHFRLVNYGKHTKGGLLNISQYFFRADYFYLNWIENASTFQGTIFIIIFHLLKLCNKKIIWTHHNIHPHHENKKINEYIMKLLVNKADCIVVHTKESYPYLNMKVDNPRIFHFFHPFFSEIKNKQRNTDKPIYDLLIWGNVRKSKGIEEFLQFLKKERQLDQYRIKIVGKFESPEYYYYLRSTYAGKLMEFEDNYLSDDQIYQLHKLSKFIFFPYTGSSVLNSGALMRSLSYGTPIIGPNVGGFKEMGDMGYILKYSDFSDVANYLQEGSIKCIQKVDEFNLFKAQHSWKNFGKSFYEKIQNLN